MLLKKEDVNERGSHPARFKAAPGFERTAGEPGVWRARRGSLLFYELGLFELRLRELAQLADRLDHFRAIRRRELDYFCAVDGVLLPQADIAAVGDEHFDIGLTSDAHCGCCLLASAHRRGRVRRLNEARALPGGGVSRMRRRCLAFDLARRRPDGLAPGAIR